MTQPACNVCKSTEIRGPFLGEMSGGGMRIHLYQCWGDLGARRCENTRGLRVEEVGVNELRELGAL